MTFLTPSARIAVQSTAPHANPDFPPLHDGVRLGLGGASLGNLFSAVSEKDAREVVEQALDDGCVTFDTAPHYGNGLSEHRMGTVLRGLPRERFFLSSKVGRLLRPAHGPRDENGYVGCLPFAQVWDYSAAGVRRSVHDSLQRMGLARLDTAYVHDCDALTHGSRYPQVLRQVLDEALPTLRALQREGLVGRVGLGVNDVQVCLDVLREVELDALLLAGRYTLVDHGALRTLLPLCWRKGVRIALGGVFNSGVLATGVRRGGPVRFNYAEAPRAIRDRVAAVEAACDEMGVPLRAAALQFPLAHPCIDVVLVGARNPAEWHDARSMLQRPIPASFWTTLRERGFLPAEAPLPMAE